MPRKAPASIIDPNQAISIRPGTCAIGIFRKPWGQNPEHAFIMAEFIDETGNICFWKVGFFVDKDGKGEVHPSNPVTVEQGNQIRARNVLRDEVLGGDQVVGKCWSLPQTFIEKLQKLVDVSAKNPGVYNLGGDVLSSGHTAAATAASEAAGSGDLASTKKALVNTVAVSSGGGAAHLVKQVFGQVGHNCFTWARAMLHGLNVPAIQKALPTRVDEFFAGSRVSKHLPVPKQKKKPKQKGGGGMASRLGAKPKQDLGAGGGGGAAAAAASTLPQPPGQ